MIKSFEMPTLSEGFDEIVLFNRFAKRGEPLLQQMVGFDQDNPNHSLDLFSHCAKTADFIRTSQMKMAEDEQEILRRAAMYHDIGKLFTKTYKDSKGKATKYAHYYHHENVGAYMCLLIEELSLPDRIRVAQLVGYHMQPYFNKTEKAQKRWRERLGERLYELVMELHRADEYAH
jgi:putative nucleotidyltransferase with HDIG domain